MNIQDMYWDFPNLQTEEEIEEGEIILDLPSWYREKTMNDMNVRPDAENRRAFEARPPAMGLTSKQIDKLEAYYEAISPAEQRSFFRMLRCSMLRQLISTSGCDNFSGLCEILREEVSSGVPAPIPQWYSFSSTTMGPRKIGYDPCENRGCFKTETVESGKFGKCSECRMPAYCSSACQMMDWKARHKKMCKHVSKQRDQVTSVSKMMQKLSDASLSGAAEDGGDFTKLFESVMGGGKAPKKVEKAIRNRRSEIKAEKRRPKEDAIVAGSEVTLVGLASRPELNGKVGVVLSFDNDSGRYAVEVEGESKAMSIKPGNLELLLDQLE